MFRAAEYSGYITGFVLDLRIPNSRKYEQEQHRDGKSSAGGVAKHRG